MTLRIVQITDTHLTADIPQRAKDLQLCIEQINTLRPQPDLVIHTGDVTHNGLAEEYNTARRLLDTLDAPYCVLAGNKDNRQELLKAFADGQYLQPGADWIQYSIEQFQTRILVADTVSTDSNKGRFCAARLAQLEEMLQADSQRPAVLFLHHPPFEATEIPDPLQFEDWAEVDALCALLARYPNLQSIYCGHVHRNIDAGAAGLPVSALTCLAGDLRKGKVSEESRKLPVFKVLEC